MPIRHVVKRGDCIASIAAANGFHTDTIWNHPANHELRKKREDRYILFEDDVVFIPDKRPREEARATDAWHRFVRTGVPEVLRIVVLDEFDKPVRDTPYTLTVERRSVNGKTDGDGRVHERISPGAKEGWLKVGEGDDRREYELQLGHLDPITELQGVQMRLSNLGYDCGTADGILGPRTRRAIAEFQRQYGLEESGECDADLRKHLKERYGS